MASQPDNSMYSGRIDPRRQLLVTVKLRRPCEGWFNSKIADLSTSGFRLHSFVKLIPGTDLFIMLPGFESRRAIVVWVKGHEAGCRFERPLYPAIFDHLIREHGDNGATA